MTNQLDKCIKTLKKCFKAPDILDKSKVDDLQFQVAMTVVTREIENGNLHAEDFLRELEGEE